jgi:hypothetical protein
MGSLAESALKCSVQAWTGWQRWKGRNIYALAKILGHANPKMMVDRYAHLSPEFIAEQRAVMDRGAHLPSA